MSTNQKEFFQLSTEEPNQFLSFEEQLEILNDFARKVKNDLKELDPEFAKTVDSYFWDLV